MDAKIKLSPIADFSAYVDGGKIVAFNVGPNLNPYLVVAMNPLDYRIEEPGWASFAKTVPDVPQRYRVLSICDDQVTLDVMIEQANFNVHDVQPLGRDILLICARSYYRGPDDYELNGHVFDRQGRALKSILLGDGIGCAQAAGDSIWIGYSDEGVYGNYGWTAPVGESGFVAWDRDGTRLFTYEPVGALDAITDCYALNVASESVVWCYYYTDFPLVRLRDMQVEAYWRHLPVTGSDAFAVYAGHALFRGGYHEKDRYALLAIEEQQKPQLLRQLTLGTHDGVDLVADRAVGRGSAIWLLRGSLVYRLDVEAVLAA